MPIVHELTPVHAANCHSTLSWIIIFIWTSFRVTYVHRQETIDTIVSLPHNMWNKNMQSCMYNVCSTSTNNTMLLVGAYSNWINRPTPTGYLYVSKIDRCNSGNIRYWIDWCLTARQHIKVNFANCGAGNRLSRQRMANEIQCISYTITMTIIST